MPYQFQYYPTEFQCNLKRERCVGHTKTGNRCKRNVFLIYRVINISRLKHQRCLMRERVFLL